MSGYRRPSPGGKHQPTGHSPGLETTGRHRHNTDMSDNERTVQPQQSGNQRNRILALAALVQATKLAQNIARKGMADETDMQACIGSLFAGHCADIAEAYGELRHLSTGLRELSFLLHGHELAQAKEMLTHTSGLMALEKRLGKHPDMLNSMREGMERINKQANYFDSILHENVMAGLAGLYGETISTLKPRIIVHGRPIYLHQHSNTNRIRALLLSGIRATHLWRQNGGSHLKLLFSRRRLAHDADALLKEAASH